ncbi:MAG: metalloregulator ArsR/SmtB family transcription factor [Fusobacterium sp.]|uniref:ArsR/SmtB family transcription factor n=1 Tax=Fusobacterium sp. TaxID=68766 RepID=UPI0026DDC719|nr:metalloregulator ArsR/SmtB family transcription factor [Fusobacterium sp.]MDO4689873.1 metalloregulator ArsR/SmtB family transcription factor [Fusobacterium sp.]
MSKEKQILEVAEIFKLLSNPLRLGIVCYLSERGKLNVNELRELFPKYSQPSISQQLQILKSNKLLKDEKEGQFVYYSVLDLRMSKFMNLLRELYCEEDKK